LFVLGWLLGFIGVVINFFELKRDRTESREVRYPKAKQPWEKQ
jgi:hypothetical protein